MARKTSGCTFFVLLVILGFTALTMVFAIESMTVAFGVAGLWLLALVFGIRRIFSRQRLGGTLAVTAAFWFAISGLLVLDMHRERREAVERRASLVADIEVNYRRGVDFLEQGDPSQALKYLSMVEKVDPEYKDLWELLDMAREQKKAERVELLVSQAEKLPATEFERLSVIYGELAQLRPDETLFVQRAQTYGQQVEEKRERERRAEEERQRAEEAQRQAERQQRAEERQQETLERRRRSLERERQYQLEERERAASQLELWSFDWRVEDGFAQASGRVENISDWPLTNIEARVRYFNRAGQVVMTDACLVSTFLDQAISPKSSASFRCVKEAAGSITSANVTFATVQGSPLQHYDRTAR